MTPLAPHDLQQAWPAPARLRPIVLIGAGGIVRDAHLPAYRKAGFPVAGIYDVNAAAARERAQESGVRVFDSFKEATNIPDAVFDLATPPGAHESALSELPDESVVVIQKPMGRNLAEAQRIVDLCQRKRLKAAVNFQLRFAPYMLAMRDLVQRQELGELVDVEVHLNLETPWDLFPFLAKESRVEILVHTVHHLDLIRLFLGDPGRVFARTVKHPRFPNLASVRSSIILDYGEWKRCCLSVNHCHRFGLQHMAASIRVEGTEGCAIATLGLLLDYPRGVADRLEVIGRSFPQWTGIPLEGRWFPDAFIGVMSNVQRFAAGEDAALVSPVSDALETMRLVEACYESNQHGGIELKKVNPK
ncbi:MAG TPA: Gfo/Idh/MocA family oxidoreductase [Verrucomicrobiae bacterium]|nr:Gfo/Idh/MocA family oxidoreductase [Verrucomicrobiae bacterium]